MLYLSFGSPALKSIDTDPFDFFWMERALGLARQAEANGEVPVGAVLVRDEDIIGEGYNSPISRHDPSAHAEIVALRAAGLCDQNYRLPGTTLYVTLEPCCMCAGAIIQARVERLVYAAADPGAGAAGSVFDLLQSAALNHRVEVSAGVMADEAAGLLTEFFRSRR